MPRTKDELRQEVARINVELERRHGETPYLTNILRRVGERYRRAKRTVFPRKYYKLKRLVRLAAHEPSTTMPERQGSKGLAENCRDLARLQELQRELQGRDRNWLEQTRGERHTTLAQLNELNSLHEDIKKLHAESRQKLMWGRYIMLKRRVKEIVRAFGSMS